MSGYRSQVWRWLRRTLRRGADSSAPIRANYPLLPVTLLRKSPSNQPRLAGRRRLCRRQHAWAAKGTPGRTCSCTGYRNTPDVPELLYTNTGTGTIPLNSTAYHYERLQNRFVDQAAQDASDTAFVNERRQEGLQASARNLQDLLQSEPAKSSTVEIQPLGTNLYVRNYQTFGNR